MDEYRIRITNANFIENITCTPLPEALDRGQIRDSIYLSEAGHLALKLAGIENYNDVNVPVGMQPMAVEFVSTSDKNDKFLDAIYRPVVGTCPEQKCGKCILDIMPGETQIGGAAALNELQWSSYVNYNLYR